MVQQEIAHRVAKIAGRANATISRTKHAQEIRAQLRCNDDLFELFLLEYDSMMSRRTKMLATHPDQDTFDEEWMIFKAGIERVYGQRVLQILLIRLDQAR